MAKRTLSPEEVEALGLPVAPPYDPTVGTGKVYNPNSDVTETRVGFKLVAPSEGGNRTGKRVLSKSEAIALGLPVPEMGEEKAPGMIETAGRQFVQGFTKEGGEEAAAGIASALIGDPAPGATWGKGRDGSALETTGDVYRSARDSDRERLAAMREHHPKISLAANIAGDVTSDGVAALLGLNPLSSSYQTAVGGLRGFLGSDAEMTPSKMTPASAASAMGSTAFGAAAGKLAPIAVNKVMGSKLAQYFGGGLRKAGEAVGDGLENLAQRSGMRAMGTSLGAYRALSRKGEPERIAKRALDEDLIPLLGNAKSIKERASKRLASTNKSLGRKYDKADEAADAYLLPGRPGVTGTGVADKIQSELIDPASGKVGHMGVADGELQRLRDNFRKLGPQPMRFREQLDQKLSLDDLVNHDSEQSLGKEFIKKGRGILNRNTEESLGDVVGPKALRAFRNQKKLAGDLHSIEDIAGDRAFRENANRVISPSSHGVGAALGVGKMSAGDTMQKAGFWAGAAALANQQGIERGGALSANAFRGASDLVNGVLERSPQILGDFGAVISQQGSREGRLAMHQALIERSPAYADMWRELLQKHAAGGSTETSLDE
jgi:hypothetical protein